MQVLNIADPAATRQRQVTERKARTPTNSDKHIWRGIVTGAYVTRHRLYRAKLCSSPCCTATQQCVDQGAIGDQIHLFWQCPCSAHTRRTIELATSAFVDEAGSTVAMCGLPLAIEGVQATRDQLFTIHTLCDDSMTLPRQGEVIYDRNVALVWTDGSGKNMRHRDLARCGIGVFYNHNSTLNVACPLSGIHQTVPRAELMAVIVASRRAWCRTIITLDNQPVAIACKQITDDLALCKVNGLASEKNCDSLHEFQQTVFYKQEELNDSAPIEVRWTKGHATGEDLLIGVTTPLDQWGNIGADELANRGADQRRSTATLSQNISKSIAATILVQAHMIATARHNRYIDDNTNLADSGECLGVDDDDLGDDGNADQSQLARNISNVQELCLLDEFQQFVVATSCYPNFKLFQSNSLVFVHTNPYIGDVALHGASVTLWSWSSDRFKALQFYLSGTRWTAAGAGYNCTWVELTLEFIFTTNVLPVSGTNLGHRHDAAQRQSRSTILMSRVFKNAVERLQQIVGTRLLPRGICTRPTRRLSKLGFTNLPTLDAMLSIKNSDKVTKCLVIHAAKHDIAGTKKTLHFAPSCG